MLMCMAAVLAVCVAQAQNQIQTTGLQKDAKCKCEKCEKANCKQECVKTGNCKQECVKTGNCNCKQECVKTGNCKQKCAKNNCGQQRAKKPACDKKCDKKCGNNGGKEIMRKKESKK